MSKAKSARLELGAPRRFLRSTVPFDEPGLYRPPCPTLTFEKALPVTLRPSRAKWVGALLVSSAFFAVGLLMVGLGEPKGYFCAGFFGLCSAVFGVTLHPKAAYLELTAEGFTFCSLFRAHTLRWEHVSDFGVAVVGLNRFVGWNFAPGYPGPERGRALSRSLSGFEAALPLAYGMNLRDLAQWMEEIRRQAADPER